MRASQSSHRLSLINDLNERIQTRSYDENLSFHDSALRELVEWLGYDVDDVTFIESADRGIDAWVFNNGIEGGLDIFQLKTHDPDASDELELSSLGSQGVEDLSRAKDFLLHEKLGKIKNPKLKRLLRDWNSLLIERREKEQEIPIQVSLHLLLIGDGLTDPAQLEYEAFSKTLNEPFALDSGEALQFHSIVYGIDEIIDGRWRETNREWKDLNGKKKDRIDLTPLDDQFVSDNKNAIFYSPAIDLVSAFSSLGYQLFEPNVRAEIRKSKVNQAIRDSVMYDQSRKDFRFLNNGVTITCESFMKPNPPQKPFFRVSHPGIVNGLQTVVALFNAYTELSDQEKKRFDEDCWVLTRLLLTNAVDDINQVVRATNNQNPMQPRNLVSNNFEQVLYFRTFAENLGWFYEAKQGAWEAFQEDPKRWRPRLIQRPADFKPSDKRKRVRRLDNSRLAQSWLSFVGYSQIAINEKRSLFDEKYYPFIFSERPIKHGYDYGYDLKQARDEAINQSPDSSLMLVSYLSHEFAKFMTPSPMRNRKEAYERLGLDQDRPRQELDIELSKDENYVLAQALNAMGYLFVEYVGFVMFRSFQQNIHSKGSRILSNQTFGAMAGDSLPDLTADEINAGDFEPNDLMAVLWHAFVDIIQDLFSGAWGTSYKAAVVKTRFVLRPETRNQVYRAVIDLDSYMKKKTPMKKWSIGLKQKQGFFEFVSNLVAQS